MVAALHTGTSSSANTGASARNKEASPKCALQVPAGTALTRPAANPNPAHHRQRLAAVWGRRAGFLACNWLSALSINDCCGSFSRVRERERGAGGWWEALEFASEKRLVGGRRRAGETVGGRERGSWSALTHTRARGAGEGREREEEGGGERGFTPPFEVARGAHGTSCSRRMESLQLRRDSPSLSPSPPAAAASPCAHRSAADGLTPLSPRGQNSANTLRD